MVYTPTYSAKDLKSMHIDIVGETGLTMKKGLPGMVPLMTTVPLAIGVGKRAMDPLKSISKSVNKIKLRRS